MAVAMAVAGEDKQKAMAAVQQDGYALEDVTEELKKDKEVVMAAVQQNGYALRHAPEGLKCNRAIGSAHVVLELKTVPNTSTRCDGDDVDDDNARVPRAYETPGGE